MESKIYSKSFSSNWTVYLRLLHLPMIGWPFINPLLFTMGLFICFNRSLVLSLFLPLSLSSLSQVWVRSSFLLSSTLLISLSSSSQRFLTKFVPLVSLIVTLSSSAFSQIFWTHVVCPITLIMSVSILP